MGKIGQELGTHIDRKESDIISILPGVDIRLATAPVVYMFADWPVENLNFGHRLSVVVAHPGYLLDSVQQSNSLRL